jgi:ergothioneine biosynthesis protein EgtB
MLLENQAADQRDKLAAQYHAVRTQTLKICQNIAIEDYVVQPCAEVSPPKWHLGHTTWFFEELILVKFLKNYTRFNEQYKLLFNSYYKSAGKHWLQSKRGYLSRPCVADVIQYRKYVDEHMAICLQKVGENAELDFLFMLGLHHEQQHQELLYMDIKYIFGVNPLFSAYENSHREKARKITAKRQNFSEGIYKVGHTGNQFSFDNECPQHKTYIYPFQINVNTVTNEEYLAFIEDGGYEKPSYWLSQGWDWVNASNIHAPLYWQQENNAWYEYTLYGMQLLDPHAPVTHISYFEADAFAAWSGMRLPTEQEAEIFLQQSAMTKQSPTEVRLHPLQAENMAGEVWCWTSSHYSPYPRFQTFDGMVTEYNGKFMSGQFVLKGGCVVTPYGHYRHSYRNFYQPEQRWMFSGVRLAKDL